MIFFVKVTETKKTEEILPTEVKPEKTLFLPEKGTGCLISPVTRSLTRRASLTLMLVSVLF